MTFILTASQERALDLSLHLSVTANAGAGKTSVLARRFVEIFLQTDAPLSGVVAITFTEQAAGELRGKIHDVILERERSPGLPPRELRRLTGLRNQLSSAIIGTIHSFCGRILRMYPAEAGVDASFTVVEGQDRTRLIGESIAETFSGVMGRGAGTAADAEFRDLLRAVPPQKLERLLLRMFAQREQIYRLITNRPGRVTPGAASGETNDLIARAILDRAAGSDWTGRARTVAAAAGGKDAARVLEMLPPRGAHPDPARLEAALAEAGAIMFSRKGDFRKSFLTAEAAETIPCRADAEYIRDFEARYARILRSIRAGDAAGRELAYERLLATLERVFLAAQDRYGAKKEDLGVLDFEDLQIRTLELLSRDGVRERIRAGYRFFLVDEFQDTNDLQYAILKGLLGDFGGGNLFIVGDPKQSIYGFRNAEVGVFYDARDDIAAAAARGGGAGGGGSVVLAESFRPLPEIAAFVNSVFSRLMKKEGARHEVDYDRIVVGRASSATGSVGLLLVSADPERGRAAAVREECALVARRLREIAGGEGGGGYTYAQCALLLRDRTNLPALEKAFEEAGIPYLLSGGVGFFQTQEIFDFLNYLRFLVDPGDDPALAGILRSPFFCLSDAEIFAISLHRGSSLLEKLRRAASGERAPGRVVRSERLLGAHRSLADRIPVPRLLRRIAADTGWLGTMAGLSHGPQHRENFLKLLDLARRRTVAGSSTLYDFTAYLDQRAEEEEREGQAATSAAGKAVRVMTVHAAKGLEFPVVVLPFLDRVSRSDHEPLIDPAVGIGIRVPGDGEAPMYGFLKALSEEKRIAEEKRVFYVACTRARDVLLLSGSERERPSRFSPLGWLRSLLWPAGIPEGSDRLDLGGVGVRCLVQESGKPVYTEKRIPLSVELFRSDRSVRVAAAEVSGGRAPTPARILTGAMADTAGGETYSATRLVTFMECPVRYYLTYVLGLGDDASTDVRDDDPDEASGARGNHGGGAPAGLVGELTHQVLSGLGPSDPESSVRERVSAAVRPCCAGAEAGGLEDRVSENIMAFLASAAGRDILSRPGARTEYQISALLGDAIVMGKIDRLFRGEDGLIEFVDYKTDRVTAGEVASRAVSHKPQIAIYAWLISRLFGQSTVRGTLLFLRHTGSPVSFTFGGEEFSAVERSLVDSVSGIRKGLFTPPATPCAGCPSRPGGVCRVLPALPSLKNQ
jgi:ATP-dependent helicase/nuclease subunit A